MISQHDIDAMAKSAQDEWEDEGIQMAAEDAAQPKRGQLIAFTGPAGAGKTTAADILVAEGWERIKFAAPLKEMMRSLYRFAGVPEEGIEARIEGRLKEEPDPVLLMATPRHAMQTLGTEWGRDMIRSQLWVHLWKAKVWRALGEGRDVVVDDCRFYNEGEAILDLGGLIVGVAGRDKGLHPDHPSERLDVEPHIYIHNTGTRDDLRDEVMALL